MRQRRQDLLTQAAHALVGPGVRQSRSGEFDDHAFDLRLVMQQLDLPFAALADKLEGKPLL
jgi:hypothetical protein